MSTSKGSDGDDKSSNDGSEPDIKDCAFVEDDTEYAEDMMKVDNEEEGNFMGKDWEWNNWAPHDVSQEIPGPKIEDKYYGPHGLEDSVENKFTTALQC
eukprot:223628-Ditylum_brightwellii.AAC.1